MFFYNSTKYVPDLPRKHYFLLNLYFMQWQAWDQIRYPPLDTHSSFPATQFLKTVLRVPFLHELMIHVRTSSCRSPGSGWKRTQKAALPARRDQMANHRPVASSAGNDTPSVDSVWSSRIPDRLTFTACRAEP